jgi:hypothetical protein
LPDNTEQTGAAAGIKTAPATWACTDTNQAPSYGQLYRMNQGAKQYLPAAVPSGVPDCSPNKRIVTIYTETTGDFAGYFSINADFDGVWNPDLGQVGFSEPLFFDYVVKDKFGVTAEGTVKLVFDGRRGIPVDIDITLLQIIQANNTSTQINVNEFIVLNPGSPPTEQVAVATNDSLSVVTTGQNPSGNTVITVQNPLGQTITAEVADASCTGCTTEAVINAQFTTQTEDGKTCSVLTGTLPRQVTEDCESLGSGGFAQVGVTTNYDAGGGSLTVTSSLMLQVTHLE